MTYEDTVTANLAAVVEAKVSRRTLARWLLDNGLAFPRPRYVNHRLYFERSAVEAWKTATAIKVAEAV